METFGVLHTGAATWEYFKQAAKAAGKTFSLYFSGDWEFKPWRKSEGGMRLAKTVTPEMVAEAHAAGALQMDVQIAQVLDLRDGDSIWNDPDAAGKAIREGNQYALWLHGVTERAGRAISYTASLQWLRATTDIIRGETGRWKQGLATLERLGFRGRELELLLDGDPDTVARFARVAVREKQFSYDISQSPLMFTTPMGRALFQFQRWGFQRLRDFARNVVKPATSGTRVQINGETHKVRDFMPLARMALMAVGAGELYALLRELLYDRERREATIEEIVNTADTDGERALMLGLERVAVDYVLDGGLGIVADYAQMGRDMATRGWRYKNPLEPPSIKFGKDMVGIVTGMVQQEGSLAALGNEVGSFMRTLPAARTLQAASASALTGFGIDVGWAERSRAHGQKANLRNMVRRYADEQGLDVGRPMFHGGVSKTPMSASYVAMEDALLVGDWREAARLKKELLASARPAERSKILNNLKASVRGRQPMLAQGVERDEVRRKFEAWLEKRRPQSAAELLEVQRRYRRAAKRAGLD